MTRGGVTPPIPPGTTAAQVFANAACTTRPVPNNDYTSLYVRLNRRFGFGDYKVWGEGGGDGGKLRIATPATGTPDDYYQVRLYVDWESEEQSVAFAAGSVIECIFPGGANIGSNPTFDFYDE